MGIKMFSDRVKDIVSYRDKLEERSGELTSLLASSMKVLEVLKDAESLKVFWPVGDDYTVVPVSRFRRTTGWRIELEVLPNNIFREVGPSSVGWNNKEHLPFSEGWIYEPSGTSTIVLPPDEVVSELLEVIGQESKILN